MFDSRQLTESEQKWVQRYQFLEENGYRLRPRYRPGWKPSWVSEDGVQDEDAFFAAEDSIIISRAFLLDAERMSDNKTVILKHTKAETPEIPIGQYLSSPDLQAHPHNHSIPLLDVLKDPSDPEHVFLVFPLLRPITFPRFATVGECLDFMKQMLEGLCFLHEHEIAHRDCATPNIMMDARLMFPKGWHAINMARLPDGKPSDRGITRTEAGYVRYYFIDFGYSSKGEYSVHGQNGIERAPELETGDKVPYDPFKLDIYMLGLTFKDAILNRTRGAEFIVGPMVQFMLLKAPHRRPTPEECLERLEALERKLSTRAKERRLRIYEPKEENKLGTYLMDSVNYLANFRRKPLEHPKEIPSLDPLS
ncbi:hypothetical protein FRC03_011438 [Tulasnella sp. 419]|nr:hypothetical protein FRC03_011438 [Tulasnella sp. 419]